MKNELCGGARRQKLRAVTPIHKTDEKKVNKSSYYLLFKDWEIRYIMYSESNSINNQLNSIKNGTVHKHQIEQRTEQRTELPSFTWKIY